MAEFYSLMEIGYAWLLTIDTFFCYKVYAYVSIVEFLCLSLYAASILSIPATIL